MAKALCCENSNHFESKGLCASLYLLKDFVKVKKRFQEISGTIFNGDSEFIKEFFSDFMRRENLDGHGKESE